MLRRHDPAPTLLRAAVFAAVALSALAAGAARPAPAAAATPCWKKLLNDWYDGRINNTYAVHCYRDALKHLPTDVQEYSSAHDDILRALQSAIAKRRAKHESTGNNTLVPPQQPPKGGGTGGKGGIGGGGDKRGGGGGGNTVSNTTGGGTTGPGLAATGNASNPSSIPVPLLVLGGLAVLLVAAGGAGLIVKRIQARRAAP
jgi:hypothetical protein